MRASWPSAIYGDFRDYSRAIFAVKHAACPPDGDDTTDSASTSNQTPESTDVPMLAETEDVEISDYVIVPQPASCDSDEAEASPRGGASLVLPYRGPTQ